MARRVFLSYQHRDHGKAKGFNLMGHNPNVKLDFTCRHLLSPVNSENPAYISSKIKEQIKGTSATVVLIGRDTANSDWVANEIDWSREKGNGIVGILIDPDATIPPGLTEAGAEILDWARPEDVHQFDDAIERAIAATNRSNRMVVNSASTCAR